MNDEEMQAEAKVKITKGDLIPQFLCIKVVNAIIWRWNLYLQGNRINRALLAEIGLPNIKSNYTGFKYFDCPKKDLFRTLLK